MENTVIAKIDVSCPSGRKLVRELEKKRAVELEYPASDDVATAIAEGRIHTVEESFGRLLDRLSEHYGTNMRNLVKL
jgi:hypothetical protein